MSEKYAVQVDPTRCKSYGVCVSVLPDVFDTPKGSPVVILLREVLGEEEREDLEEAVRACPAQALSFGPAPS